ncbi:MAG: class I SAM-dependent methyltransferase [Pseudomonadota bacterium]
MATELPFTGERFTPECVREMSYEHWHRYALAAPLTAGRKVLDLACGEGYGSHLLSQAASDVTGMDRHEPSIKHARQRYTAENLKFVIGNATRIPMPSDTFDAIVSFETLEHLREQEQMLSEFARVLADDGFLILSSPDKAVYSDARGYRNEHHVRELYQQELESLLKVHFPAVRLLGQALLFQSCAWPLDPQEQDGWEPWFHQDEAAQVQATPPVPAMYFVAICARQRDQLPKLPRLSLYSDAAQSVYRHYEHEIRKNMQAGAIVADRDAQIEALTQRVAELERQLKGEG